MRTFPAVILASTLSAAITYAATKAEVREPVSPSVIDSICVQAQHDAVDAGSGLPQRRAVTGLTFSVRGQLASLVADEPSEPVRLNGVPCTGACRTNFVSWAQTYVMPTVSSAVKLP